jgi:hypothetical protein
MDFGVTRVGAGDVSPAMRSPSNRLLLGLVALAMAAALAGCGSDEGEPAGVPTSPTAPTPSTEPTARETEFTGYLVQSGDEARICEALAESYPPQCGGRSYRLVGFDARALSGVEQANGVSWTQQQVTVRGVLADDGETLVVSPNPALGGGPPPPGAGEQPGAGSG